MEPKYPDVTVQLSGGSGNAGAIVGAVARALQKAGVPEAERDEFRREAYSGNYDNVIQTAMKWVDVS
jgi:ribosomal protein S9